ncbi:MAG: hypothetical protein AAFR16_07415 [Pseudomonadota bacterium]
MKAFVLAMVAIAALTVGASFGLDTVDEDVSEKYVKPDSVRVD